MYVFVYNIFNINTHQGHHHALVPIQRLTPHSLFQVFFQGASVKQVDVPTLTGAFGILPAHVPTLQVLRPGVVTVYSDEGVGAKYFGELLVFLG